MIEVVIGANVDQATANLKKLDGGIVILQNQLARLQRLAALPDLSFNQLNRLNGLIGQTQSKLKQFEGTFGTLRSSSNSATASLVNIGRVFQDLPYGIIGVANNINPLVEGLGRLSAEAKAAGTTLGASLLKSLTGAGGLALGFSVVTSVLQFATIGLSAFSRNTGQAKENVDELKASLDATASSINNAAKNLDTLKSALDFTIEFGSIGLGGADVLGLKLQQQKVLVEQIRQQKVFADQALNELTTDPRRITGTKKEREEIEKTISESISKLFDLNTRYADESTRVLIINKQLSEQQLKDTKEALEKSRQDWEKYLSNIISFANAIQQVTGGGPFGNFAENIFDTKAGNARAAQEFVNSFYSFINKELKKNPILANVKVVVDPNAIDTEALAKSIKKSLEDQSSIFNKVDISKSIKGIAAGGKEVDAEIRKQQELWEKQAAIISGTLVPAFEAMFDAIRQGTSPMKAFFQGLIQSVNQLISRLIAAAIQAAILSAISGGTASFGKTFINILLGGKGFAQGGVVPGGYPNDTYPALLSSNETVLTPSQLSGLIQNRGSGPMEVDVNLIMDGVLYATARAQARQKRSYGK